MKNNKQIKKPYDACPNCGFPLAPMNVAITEGFFRNTITKGKECMKCKHRETYTYKERSI